MSAAKAGAVAGGPSRHVRTDVAENFTQWHHLVSQSFVPLEVRTSTPDRFNGRLRSRILDELSLVEVSATGHQVLRTPSLIASSDRLYFKLNLQLSGTGILVQDQREAMLRPGDLAVYDTHRPYTLAMEDDFRTLVLMFPHDVLDLPADEVAQLTAVRLAGDEGLGRVISPFMVQLAENLDYLTGTSGHRLARNAIDLVATMFEGELDARRRTDTGGHPELLGRIRRYIEANLGNPDLSPAEIAAAHYVSTRHLHNIFAASGTTVASWIRTRRLEHCRRDLRDPVLADRPVGSIASRWGFVDAAHFSRIFRSTFGEPPSSYRRQPA
ncbi:helix-turn-helix domain-containing protein [Crystallibacter crystallopoietes]|uniref:AraC-like ligand-binding domain-containing protein n=1 Tax=Crystallibacter crystallopoietes TaxID=37928 RepID=UPI0002A4F0F9|nr:helix-turn-helix domain-containing protein [Arthrobacter crystallopoietes]